ncbi:MAG TPA: 50S ribosomal protein L11 methyltransferase [Candidatus Faecivivens stercoripullorum]|uniref:Ribosomal protein L11 methyltransferase n=1 Tax=Candidatus Faecivivens stercoripullorum TaxID=2840805 RepID=A0A9D1KRU9_9FIRM|nr:50S ribosomal protein L11 methyltransferase [Candidatus Faecivivens stercoripullorum]
MNWAEIAIKTTTEGIEIVNGFLMAHGVNSVMIEDAADFQNFLEDTTIYWDYVDDKLMEMAHCDTRVKFYLPDTPQGHETLAQIQADITRLQEGCELNLGELAIEIGYKEQEEWETAWQKYYHPIEISDRLIIVPEWEHAQLKEGQHQLLLNPGMAFGTGDHNTTRLCLQVLDSQMPEGVSVLDMGCGSGILSIAALMLGAKHVTAVDIDQLATKIARENAELNHIPEPQLDIICGNVLNDQALADTLASEPVDLIVANIVADVIIGMAPLFIRCLKKGGQLIVSGIISERAEEVLNVLRDTGFTVTGQQEDGGWCAASLRA